MNKTLKWILIILGSALVLYVGFVFYVFTTFSFDSEKHYTKQDLIDNYNVRTQQIMDLRSFINSIVPANKSVDIEFDSDGMLNIFHVVDNSSYDSNWDLELNSPKVDSLLTKLSWTQQTLKTLKKKLDAANCISVKSGEPCNIGFQRSGMGKYYYNVFEKSIPDSLKATYNDSCTYILYNDKVALEYGGGTIGPQCFPRR